MKKLADILNQELDTFNRFLTLLDAQHKQIVSRDLTDLNKTNSEIDLLSNKTHVLEKRRIEEVRNISRQLKLNQDNLKLGDLLPRLDRCAWCGGELEETGDVAFAAGAGGVVCSKCKDATPERISVSRGAVAVLNKLATTPLIKVERLRISGTIAKDVRKMLARLWMHIMGREPRMLKYLQ